MKEYLLFTRFDLEGDINIFQGDYDTSEELFDAIKCHSRESGNPGYYKIISFHTDNVLAEGPIKNLIELLPAGVRMGLDSLLSPAPSGKFHQQSIMKKGKQ